jgi:transporter family protein
LGSYLPLIVGGVAPATLWGVTAVLQKLSADAALGPGRFLAVFGLVIAASGAVYAYASNETGASPRGAGYAFAAGLAYSLGTGLLSFALGRLHVPLSRVSPILSANVLIPVAIGLVFLGERAAVSPTRLVLGAAVIVAGAILVTSA